MTEHIGRLVANYGYLIVALFIFFEGMAIPFPTDTTLVTAAAFAAHGRFSLAVVFLVATASATLGTTVAFVIGRRGGDFFERHSRKVNPRVLARTRDFFDRHGPAAVLTGRFIPFARMLISPMAGLSTMSLSRFTVFNLVERGHLVGGVLRRGLVLRPAPAGVRARTGAWRARRHRRPGGAGHRRRGGRLAGGGERRGMACRGHRLASCADVGADAMAHRALAACAARSCSAASRAATTSGSTSRSGWGSASWRW